MSDENMTRNSGQGWPTEGIEQQAEQTNIGVAVVHAWEDAKRVTPVRFSFWLVYSVRCLEARRALAGNQKLT
jgi:hypothetical protein